MKASFLRAAGWKCVTDFTGEFLLWQKEKYRVSEVEALKIQEALDFLEHYDEDIASFEATLKDANDRLDTIDYTQLDYQVDVYKELAKQYREVLNESTL